MKNILTLVTLFFCCHTFAQNYPFAEGFEGMASNLPPTGWAGGMKVLGNHGRNDSKAVCARVSSAVTIDSSVTPLIGPLTSTSSLSFYYRIIDQNIYPSTPTVLDAGDSIEVLLSSDSINYHTVFLISATNHTSSFNFVKRIVNISQYAGAMVNIKFRCKFGSGGGYYVDIDTVVVKDDPQTDILPIRAETPFVLFPNPCSASGICTLQQLYESRAIVKVYQATGACVFSAPLSQNLRLQVAGWLPGVYFVQVGNVTRQLIVEE